MPKGIERLLAVAILLFGLGVMARAAGVRVLVIHPSDVAPLGATFLLQGAPEMRLIDSPEAFCRRREGGASSYCRIHTLSRLASAKVLTSLPYSDTLFSMTGAPAERACEDDQGTSNLRTRPGIRL